MQFAVAIVLIAAAAAYITSVPCRIVATRRRQASFVLSLLGVLVTAALTVLFIFQGEVFHPSRWQTSKVHTGVLMMIVFGFAVATGSVPALLVVTHYRRKFQNENHPD